ncbi:MAG: type II toxin-antitoxin system HipA family toxin [Sulfurimonas sp.]|jgi:serine/threonine-protein kinase HipA
MANKCDVYLWEYKIGSLLESNGEILFRFDSIRPPFEPSPLNAPYQKGIMRFRDLEFFEGLPGFISDALPDQYGNDLIEFYHKNIDPSVELNTIDKLIFIGNNALGAIRFEPRYEMGFEKVAKFITAKELGQKAHRIEKGGISDASDLIAFIIKSSSLGGAKKKAKVYFDPKSSQFSLEPSYGTIASIVKLGTRDREDENNALRVEYVYSLLAKSAGINIPNTHLIIDGETAHYVIERFDIDHVNGEKFHVHSFAGIKHHNIRNTSKLLDYVNLFELEGLFELTNSDMDQMYRLMLFNYMFRNQDDHGKNFSFLQNKQGEWRFAPAYDLTYSVGIPKDHKMLFDGRSGDIVTIETFIAIGKRFKIKNYFTIIHEVEATLFQLADRLLEFVPNKLWAGTILEDVRNAKGEHIFCINGFNNVWETAKIIKPLEGEINGVPR